MSSIACCEVWSTVHLVCGFVPPVCQQRNDLIFDTSYEHIALALTHTDDGRWCVYFDTLVRFGEEFRHCNVPQVSVRQSVSSP